MTKRRISMIVVTAALVGAVAGGAYAADKKNGIAFTVRSEPTSPALGAGKVLKWDASRGRWGLTLNMQELEGRPSTLGDFQAGAYFRITPSLRVGGSVALGEQPLTTSQRSLPIEEKPRVRLETAFKF